MKNFNRLIDGDRIVILQDLGVELVIPDPGGQIGRLLDLLDGSRTVQQAHEGLKEQWPELSLDEVQEGVTGLDAVGLLEDASAEPELRPDQRDRYASNLAYFGGFAKLRNSRYSFQRKLLSSHVLLLGAGGVGSSVLQNLAGLGVGHVTVLECDILKLKNLVRQFLYSEAEVGQPKLELAVARARSLNSEIKVTPVDRRVTGPEDVAPLLPGVSLVISAIDEPHEVDEWVNEACVDAGVTLLSGGVRVRRGIYTSVQPGITGCLACMDLLASRRPGESVLHALPDTVSLGIGPTTTLMGGLIALEAVRYLTGYAPPISAGKVWLVDFATGQTQVSYEWSRQLDCPVCASQVPPVATPAGARQEFA